MDTGERMSEDSNTSGKPCNHRLRRMTAINSPLSSITRPIFQRRGFLDGKIIQDWALIVGKTLSAISLPEKITFPQGKRRQGTIHLRLDNAAFATEVQHLQPLILERINRYFGYSAVANLRIIHGYMNKKESFKSVPFGSLEESEEKELDRKLSNITDPGLRLALKNLGSAVISRTS